MDQERQKDAALAPGAGGVLTVSMILEQFVRTKQLAGRAPNTVEFYRWGGSTGVGPVGRLGSGQADR